jgi:hypothetical protein
MDAAERQAIVDELGAAFGCAEDVSPAPDQDLHVLLPELPVLHPWQPSPTRALLRSTNWPAQRPDFWIDLELVNNEGQPPASNSEVYVLGETWRGFSFQFPWSGQESATRAVQKWLNRFSRAQ